MYPRVKKKETPGLMNASCGFTSVKSFLKQSLDSLVYLSSFALLVGWLHWLLRKKGVIRT